MIFCGLTVISCKVSVLGAYVLPPAGCGVYYLNVTGDVAVTIGFTELIKRFIGDFGNVEFVVLVPSAISVFLVLSSGKAERGDPPERRRSRYIEDDCLTPRINQHDSFAYMLKESSPIDSRS